MILSQLEVLELYHQKLLLLLVAALDFGLEAAP
jgi:hypothetical protein